MKNELWTIPLVSIELWELEAFRSEKLTETLLEKKKFENNPFVERLRENKRNGKIDGRIERTKGSSNKGWIARFQIPKADWAESRNE